MVDDFVSQTDQRVEHGVLFAFLSSNIREATDQRSVRRDLGHVFHWAHMEKPSNAMDSYYLVIAG